MSKGEFSRQRRRFLRLLTGAGMLPVLPGMSRARARVVIVGAGYGGATCARYLAYAHARIDIVLVEALKVIRTCPFSNYVIAGFTRMDDITQSLDGLKKIGVRVIHARALSFDADRKTLMLDDGQTLSWDRLVISPGVDINPHTIEGYGTKAMHVMPHAWKAGAQTRQLRSQIRSVEDGARIIITVPEYPYRCPPAPYERASVIAWYLQRYRKRCKIIILDAKTTFAKEDLFRQGWEALYPGMIEWIGGSDGRLVRVDADDMSLYTQSGVKWSCDVANVIPPQTAGSIACRGGLTGKNSWCSVDSATLESKIIPNVHVLGDSIFPGDMPKSGFAANSQGKACAAALISIIHQRPVQAPVFMNVCYSLLAPDYGISIAGVYRAGQRRITAIQGSGGESPIDVDRAFRAQEAKNSYGWYRAMTEEMYGGNGNGCLRGNGGNGNGKGLGA